METKRFCLVPNDHVLFDIMALLKNLGRCYSGIFNFELGYADLKVQVEVAEVGARSRSGQHAQPSGGLGWLKKQIHKEREACCQPDLTQLTGHPKVEMESPTILGAKIGVPLV
ncbi:hypothetical protein Fot_35162 [Forsythia ovata]|uniref:Uncharacterized protein n=1 Tax=Forsythia ovata TaxID=205694 RepID=A0ABD1SM76_9LAMI